MKLTHKLYDSHLASINDQYDAVIVGSDQVCTEGRHQKGAYFINWEPLFKGRHISYAPCCAVNHVAEGKRDLLIDALKHFDCITARNVEMQNFVKDLISYTPKVMCDPTILHSFEEFSKPVLDYPYILVYIIGKEMNGGHGAAIENLRRKYPHCKVIGIQTCYRNPQLMPWADKYILQDLINGLD